MGIQQRMCIADCLFFSLLSPTSYLLVLLIAAGCMQLFGCQSSGKRFRFSTRQSMPFCLKLLWAPLVDSVYIRSIGRRKCLALKQLSDAGDKGSCSPEAGGCSLETLIQNIIRNDGYGCLFNTFGMKQYQEGQKPSHVNRDFTQSLAATSWESSQSLAAMITKKPAL